MTEGAAMSFGINVKASIKSWRLFWEPRSQGLTGAIYVHRMTFIFSSSFAFTVSISILSMVVVGGIGT